MEIDKLQRLSFKWIKRSRLIISRFTKWILVTSLLNVLVITICSGQNMLGKSTDDILNKYKSNPDYVLIKLRVPDGVVIPPIKVTHTIDMTKTGNSENTVITYKIKPNNYRQNFLLISDRCIQYDTYYNIKSFWSTLEKFNNEYVPLKQDNNTLELDNFYYTTKDGTIKVAVNVYRSEKTYEVSYYYN